MRRLPKAAPVYLSALATEGVAPQYLELTAPELEILAATSTEDQREVAGLALPYGEDLDRPEWFSGAVRQRFNPGSAVVRDNATLFYGHDHLTKGLPIGRVVGAEQTDAGLRLTSKISATPKGDEVYTLLRDGVLNRFSVGFYPVKAHLEDDDTTLVHDEIDVFEVSVVPDPAFQSATVDTVLGRSPSSAPKTGAITQGDTMTPEQRARLAALRAQQTLSAAEASELAQLQALEAGEGAQTFASADAVAGLTEALTTLERRIDTLGHGPAGGSDVPTVPGASFGEFVKMLSVGDKAAAEFLAYVGSSTADLGSLLKDSWVGERYKFVEAQRTALNFFSRSPLPADGMGVEYGIDGTDTTQVAEQVAEGDTLAYGKITFDTDRAPLKTYGGWGEMSFQEIQRAPIAVLERFFNALLRRYAQTTEAAVNARAVAGGVALTGGVLDMATTDGWTKFIIRAARVLKDKGYPLEGVLVGFDVFEDLAVMRDGVAADAPRFLDRRTGSINVTGLSGEVFNLPIIPIETGATTDVIRAANSEAIRTYEAGGAPFRLQDDDITNLTKAASVYGYMADATEVPGALIKPATA